MPTYLVLMASAAWRHWRRGERVKLHQLWHMAIGRQSRQFLLERLPGMIRDLQAQAEAEIPGDSSGWIVQRLAIDLQPHIRFYTVQPEEIGTLLDLSDPEGSAQRIYEYYTKIRFNSPTPKRE